MNPLEQRVQELEKLVQTLIRGENTDFNASIARALDMDNRIREIRLNDLKDVNVVGATTGQVIKYSSVTNRWTPANDIDT